MNRIFPMIQPHGSTMPSMPMPQYVLGALKRQWKVLMVTALLLFLLLLVMIVQINKEFTATALLQVDESVVRLAGVDERSPEGSTLNSRIDTEVEILASSGVTLGVIEQLKLWRNPEFVEKPSIVSRLLNLMRFTPPVEKNLEAESFSELKAQDKTGLIRQLNRMIKISRRGFTSIIAVSGTSKNAEQAATLANALVDSYLQQKIDVQAEATQRASVYLRQRVDQLAQSINETDNKTTEFIAQNIERIATPETRLQLSSLRDDLRRAETARLSANEKLSLLRRYLEKGDAATISRSSISPEVDRLAAIRQALPVSESATTDTSLKTQLKTIDQQLRTAVNEGTRQLGGQLSSLDTEASKLRQELRTKFLDQPIPSDVAVQLYRMQRDAETSKTLFDNYMARLGEVEQRVGLDLSNSRLVAAAMVPDKASFPPRLLLLAASALLAIGLGASAALARDHLVGGIISSDQLEAVTGLPVMATLQTHKLNPHDTPIDEPMSGFAEDLRRLRVGITISLESVATPIVLITSTLAAEGKSTIALALARTFAQAGKRTLLIDADLRRPTISQLMNAEPTDGVVDILTNTERTLTLDQVVTHDDKSGLLALLGGTTSHVGSDILLSSGHFYELLEKGVSEYDIVLVDSPPIGHVVDAKIIARMAHLVLYVVNFGHTNQREVVTGVREMKGGTDAQFYTVLNMHSGARGRYDYSGSYTYPARRKS